MLGATRFKVQEHQSLCPVPKACEASVDHPTTTRCHTSSSPHLGTGRCRVCSRAPLGTSAPREWHCWDPPSASSRRTCRQTDAEARAVGGGRAPPAGGGSHLQKRCPLNSSALPPLRGRTPVTWVTSRPRPSLSRRLGPSTDAPEYTHTWRPAGRKDAVSRREEQKGSPESPCKGVGRGMDTQRGPSGLRFSLHPRSEPQATARGCGVEPGGHAGLYPRAPLHLL